MRTQQIQLPITITTDQNTIREDFKILLRTNTTELNEEDSSKYSLSIESVSSDSRDNIFYETDENLQFENCRNLANRPFENYSNTLKITTKRWT